MYDKTNFQNILLFLNTLLKKLFIDQRSASGLESYEIKKKKKSCRRRSDVRLMGQVNKKHTYLYFNSILKQRL